MGTLVDVTGVDGAPTEVTVNGVLIVKSPPEGSGTGNYNPFLAISANDGDEEGFNTDASGGTKVLDTDNSKTMTLKLSDVPIKIINGVAYYDIRLDLNENNNDLYIALTAMKIYVGPQATLADWNNLTKELDSDFTKLWDLDAGGDKYVGLYDDQSGSGADNYSFLVPVSLFAGFDPENFYISVYAAFGIADDAKWDATGGFEEFNTEEAVTINGVKYSDTDGDGIKDQGEGPIEGILVYIDMNKNGVFDAGEPYDYTDENGEFNFFVSAAQDDTIWIREVIPNVDQFPAIADYVETTGDGEDANGKYYIVDLTGPDDEDPTTVVVEIGNMPVNPSINVTKGVSSITGGNNGKVDNPGDVINYVISVQNTGNIPLTGITVDDPNADPGSLQPVLVGGFNAGDVNQNGELDVGESWLYTAQHTVTQDEIDANGIDSAGQPDGDNDIDNTVTADSNETGPDTASAAVGIVYSPGLNVTKQADKESVDVPGETITYTIMVYNTGNVSLTGVTVDDPLVSNLTYVSGDTDNDGELDVNEVWTYTGTYDATQEDFDTNGGGDGDIDNTVTADSNETGPDTDSEAVVLDLDPAIDITKSADVQSVDEAGDVINYTITVTNEGDVSLTNVVVNDPLLGVLTGPTGDTDNDGELDVGETWTYTGSYTVTQDDIDANGIDYLGDPDGDGDIDNIVTVDSDQTNQDWATEAVSIVYDPNFTIQKTGSVQDGTADEAGDILNYTVVVTNTGNVTLTNLDVSDPLVTNLVYSSGDTDNDGDLDVGEAWTYTGSYVLTQADLDGEGGGDGDIDNTATADTDQTDEKSDSHSIPLVYDPDFTIVKTGSVQDGTADEAGDILVYTIVVTNTGNISLTGVTVDDPLLTNEAYSSGDTNNNSVLDVGEAWTYTGSYVLTQADLDGEGGGDGDIDNTATADTNETGSKNDDFSIPLVYSPAIAIDKVVVDVDGDGASGTADEAGDVITYDIVVTNTGNITLNNVIVTDPLTGTNINIGSLAPGESYTVEDVTYEVTQADLDGEGGGDGDIDNTATADSDETGSVQDSEAVPLDYSPAIAIDKTVLAVDVAGNGLADEAGDKIEYRVTVTNTGNITLTNVTVVDPLTGLDITIPSLAPGESQDFDSSYFITQEDLDNQGGGDGDIDNTATADSDQTDDVDDSEEVDLVYDPDFEVTKVADVDDVDDVGDVINYTVTVTNTGNVSLTGLLIDDPLIEDLDHLDEDNDGFNDGDTDLDGELDVDETWTFKGSYVVTQEDFDTNGNNCDGDIDNTVTVDFDETDEKTASATVGMTITNSIDIEKYVSVDGGVTWFDADDPTGPEVAQAGADVMFKFVVTNTGDTTLSNVSVTDNYFDLNGGDPGTAWEIGTLAPGGTAELVFDAPWQAGQHYNLATVTGDYFAGTECENENGGPVTDSDAAHYFGLINEGPGVRTPGFWQSPNGGQFWDGITGNESKAGQDCFADGELLYMVDKNGDNVLDEVGILLGDWNKNGLTDAGEDTFFISLSIAKQLINANAKQSQDMRYVLGRDAVATWLNFLAGNEVGDLSDDNSPAYLMQEAIDWFEAYADGNSNDQFDFNGPAQRANSTGWKNPIAGNDYSGSQIHNLLDEYNNFGTVNGEIYAHDCDDQAFMIAIATVNDYDQLI